MNMRLAVWILTGILAGGVLGCGGNDAPVENLAQQGNAKLQAMQDLAKAVDSKNESDIGVAVESFNSNQIDAAANSAEAKQIVEIYETKVKSKLKGNAAADVKTGVDAIKSQLK